MQSILCALGIHTLGEGEFENDFTWANEEGPLVFVCRCTHCGTKVKA